jgi:hypothetical protein
VENAVDQLPLALVGHAVDEDSDHYATGEAFRNADTQPGAAA